jgi:pyruvate formate lyase activating enzyme
LNNKIHLELTILIVSNHNDSRQELEEIFKWIADLNKDIPVHLSRYFPNYKMDEPATKEQKMEEAYKLAKKYLNYVYIGNMKTKKGQNTYCPDCGYEVISRHYFNTQNHLKDGKCPKCGKQVLNY